MPPHSSVQPPRARSIPMLAAAAIGAAITGVSPQVAVADGGDLRYDAYATVSPFAAFLMGSVDYGLDAEGIVEIGVGGSASRRFGRFFDLGLGLHYDYGRDSEYGDFAHLVVAPLMATLVIPIGASSELRAGIGLGPAYGIAGDSRRVHVLGGGMEIALAFAQRIRPSGFGLCVQLGIRGDIAPELNADPGDDLDGSELIHVQFPFIRAGVSWR